MLYFCRASQGPSLGLFHNARLYDIYQDFRVKTRVQDEIEIKT